MPKKYIVFFKSVGRKWFWGLIILILIVAFIDPIISIWITGISIILILLTYVKPLNFRIKIMRLMKKYFMIEEDTIAEKLRRPLREVQDKLFKISQRQKKKKWLIVFLNKHYIFYHQETIDKFIELYNKGLSEKEILDNLKENDLRTRIEVKIIKDTLIKHNRLSEREISVSKHREQERFK